MQWEATAFGRPVLALVLVASLAFFPVFLIPSGPSMWLSGMIFGYGLGFVIIMVGTTIGMILPYLIGLLFRDRIHVSFLLGFSFFFFLIGNNDLYSRTLPYAEKHKAVRKIQREKKKFKDNERKRY